MLNLEELQRGFEHLTPEMLDQLIDWWIRDPIKPNRDIMAPILMGEKLRRMELEYVLHNE